MVSLIIVIVYLALLFGVCGWAQVKQKKQAAAGGKVSFLMAGKNLPMLLVVMLMMGNLIGGTNTTGLAQLAMGGGGMAAVTYGLAGVVGILFLGIVGARRMRQMNYSTTAEMMADYNGSASRYLMVIGQLIICGAVTLACAYLATDIVKTLTILLCITPAFFLAMISMMYFPRLLKKHTMVITQAVAYVFFFAWLFIPAVKAAFPTPIYVEWPLCVAVFFLCYLFDKEPIKIPEAHKALQ